MRFWRYESEFGGWCGIVSQPRTETFRFGGFLYSSDLSLTLHFGTSWSHSFGDLVMNYDLDL